jgi:hypothetical protein
MRTSEEFSSAFGLTFHDADLTDVNQLSTTELTRIKSSEEMNYARLCDFPLVSINKVCLKGINFVIEIVLIRTKMDFFRLNGIQTNSFAIGCLPRGKVASLESVVFPF